MTRIMGSVVVRRPVEVVFDFAADQRNEPTYNPALTRCDKVTEAPIRPGTRFDGGTRMNWDWDMRPTNWMRALGVLSGQVGHAVGG